MFETDPNPVEIEVLVLPDTTLMLFAAIVEPLRALNRVTGRTLYRWRISSPDGAAVATTSGIAIPVGQAFAPEGAAPLIVTGSYNVHSHLGRPLLRALASAARHRPVVVGVEAGAWALGLAGLLDGYRATTHSEDLDAFAARLPEVEAVARRQVRDRNRVTTAGAGPTLDLMLDLIALRQGRARSLDVARLLNYQPGVDAAAPLQATLRDRAVARASAMMEAHLDEPMTIAAIARAVGLSPRHMQARFVAALGTAPQAHYLALRLNEARRLLLETPDRILDIAAATGFASPAGFSRSYRVHHGESPSQTRR